MTLIGIIVGSWVAVALAVSLFIGRVCRIRDDKEYIMTNIPRLRGAVHWAEAEAAKPSGLWYQGDYAKKTDCGTAHCVAGWAAVQNPAAEVRVEPCAIHGSTCTASVVDLYIDGKYVVWHDEGRRQLGLTEDEADELFAGGNDIEDIRRIAERIAGEKL